MHKNIKKYPLGLEFGINIALYIWKKKKVSWVLNIIALGFVRMFM